MRGFAAVEHCPPSHRARPLLVQVTEEELTKERDCVGHLIPNAKRAVCAITEDTMLPGEN